jgi:signal transduction histidine kinase
VHGYAGTTMVAELYRRAVVDAWQIGRGAGIEEGRHSERQAHLRTLHDTVLQTLEAIIVRAEAGADDADEALQDVARYAVRQALELRHQLARGGREGFSGEVLPILDTLVEEAAEQGLTVELNSVGLEDYVVMPQVADTLLGAVREGLNNVRKHSGVRRAVVLARRDDEAWLVVTIRDHGCGFDQDFTPIGFGLRGSIMERVAEIGGSVAVESRPGAGTRVRLVLPPAALPAAPAPPLPTAPTPQLETTR